VTVAEAMVRGKIGLPPGQRHPALVELPGHRVRWDANGPAALYAVGTSGTIWAYAGTGNPAAPLSTSATDVGTIPAGTTVHQIS
jgi:hypothetical protein